MSTFEVAVCALVCEPRNVIEFKYVDAARGADVAPVSCLLSAREVRKLAEMLLDVADKADELPVHKVRR